MLRYKSCGEVHKDFHGLTCATIHYILDIYGKDALDEILKSTAQQVYKTIHEGLNRGDCEELKEFWEYYQKREGGKYSIEEIKDGIRLVVQDCPALRHLVKLEQEPDAILCEATRIFNEALCENTPFCTTLEKTSTFSCVQVIRKKEEQQ